MLAKVYLMAHAVCVQYAAGKLYLEYDAVCAVQIIVPVVNPFGKYRAQSVGYVRVLRKAKPAHTFAHALRAEPFARYGAVGIERELGYFIGFRVRYHVKRAVHVIRVYAAHIRYIAARGRQRDNLVAAEALVHERGGLFV